MRALAFVVLVFPLLAGAGGFGGPFGGTRVIADDAEGEESTPTPLLWRFGPQSAQAVDVPALSGAFCISAKLRAQSNDWATNSIQGAFQLGETLGAANTFLAFRNSHKSGSALTVRMYDAGGVQRGYDANNAFSKATHSIAACYTPTGGVFAYVDGVQRFAVSGAFAFSAPTTLRIADLGTGVLPYGTGVEDVCIAGPSGEDSADPAVAVANVCGQFTAPASEVCAGCVTPDAGAVKVLALGDSITQTGANVFRPYPSRLNALLGVSHAVTNGGVSGNTCAQAHSRYVSTYKGQGFTKAAVLCGVNNVGNEGHDGPTTWAQLEDLLDEVRTDGLQLVPVLLTPCASSSFCNTTEERDAVAYVNTQLSAYCTTHGLTCADTSSMGTGSPLSLTTANDSDDGLHPNQAGEDALAAIVYDALTP